MVEFGIGERKIGRVFFRGNVLAVNTIATLTFAHHFLWICVYGYDTKHDTDLGEFVLYFYHSLVIFCQKTADLRRAKEGIDNTATQTVII